MSHKIVELQEINELQTTLDRSVVLRGMSVYDFGLCEAEVRSAPPGTGIVFEVDGVSIPADTAHLESGGPIHTTSLTADCRRVQTVEHFLSAAVGAGLDNLVVKLDGARGLPAPDFAADRYYASLVAGGTSRQPVVRRQLVIKRPFRVDGARGQFAVCRPAKSGGSVFVAESIFDRPIGRGRVEYRPGVTDYGAQIARARSFVASPLDGDDDRWTRVRRKFPVLPIEPWASPLVAYDRRGFITPLRFSDEPARHKLLDLLGDLALAGFRIVGEVEVRRPGHQFNATVARRLRVEAGFSG